ncbi:MAG: PrsW family glutamic-type intramembrane protease [Bacillota bacterium]
MPPIYVAALITLIIAGGLWLTVFGLMAGRRGLLVWFTLAGLPMSAVVNLWVKGPLAVAVGNAAGVPAGQGLATPIWFLVFLFLLAPVLEEAIKLVPLVPLAMRRRLAEPGAALWAGVYLGLGFGLGEVAYLAWGIARSPAYAGYPFWYFGGFFGERLLVVYLHAALTGLAASGWTRGPGRALGTYGMALGLHALANLGAMLYQLKLANGTVAQLSLVAAILVASVAFDHERRGVPRPPGKAPVTIFRRES